MKSKDAFHGISLGGRPVFLTPLVRTHEAKNDSITGSGLDALLYSRMGPRGSQQLGKDFLERGGRMRRIAAV